MTHLHLDHSLGDLRVPELDLRRQRGRVGRGGDRPPPHPQRLPAPPLRLRLRLPHGRLRPRRDRLLRDLRPHLRPLRRRLDPPRLHARPQRRPHVGDRPPQGARLRDRRRRRPTPRASSTAARRWPPRPFDAHNYRRSLQELKLFQPRVPGRDRHPGPRPGVLRELEPATSSADASGVSARQALRARITRAAFSSAPVHLPHPVEDLASRPRAGARGSAPPRPGR